MNTTGDQLPTERDFIDPASDDLDERAAVEMFLGKTPEEAQAMFRRHFLWYQEFLAYMRAPAFQFYIVPAIEYLCSHESDGDSDAANTFCGLLEVRLTQDPHSIFSIRTTVVDAIGKVLSDFERYDCDPDIYDDVPGRYRRILDQLKE